MEGLNMQDKTYKLIELVGVSATSIEEAVQNAISRANQTLKNLDWFEVVEARGLIQDGKVSQFQVKLKVGFRLLA
jgi:flavin-binding protein dodecin